MISIWIFLFLPSLHSLAHYYVVQKSCNSSHFYPEYHSILLTENSHLEFDCNICSKCPVPDDSCSKRKYIPWSRYIYEVTSVVENITRKSETIFDSLASFLRIRMNYVEDNLFKHSYHTEVVEVTRNREIYFTRQKLYKQPSLYEKHQSIWKSRRAFREKDKLFFKRVKIKDTAVYRCFYKNQVRAVLDLTVVKNGAEPLSIKISKSFLRDRYLPLMNLKVTTVKDYTYEMCRSCRQGYKHIYGQCKVSLINNLSPIRPSMLSKRISILFKKYRSGIACRSALLKDFIKYYPIWAVNYRPSELVMQPCKMKCVDAMMRLEYRGFRRQETYLRRGKIGDKRVKELLNDISKPDLDFKTIENNKELILNCDNNEQYHRPINWFIIRGFTHTQLIRKSRRYQHIVSKNPALVLKEYADHLPMIDMKNRYRGWYRIDSTDALILSKMDYDIHGERVTRIAHSRTMLIACTIGDFYSYNLTFDKWHKVYKITILNTFKWINVFVLIQKFIELLMALISVLFVLRVAVAILFCENSNARFWERIGVRKPP